MTVRTLVEGGDRSISSAIRYDVVRAHPTFAEGMAGAGMQVFLQ